MPISTSILRGLPSAWHRSPPRVIENGVDARSVDYARLSAVLIEAVKELSATVDAQAAMVDAQAARIERLEAAMGR